MDYCNKFECQLRMLQLQCIKKIRMVSRVSNTVVPSDDIRKYTLANTLIFCVYVILITLNILSNK